MCKSLLMKFVIDAESLCFLIWCSIKHYIVRTNQVLYCYLFKKKKSGFVWSFSLSTNAISIWNDCPRCNDKYVLELDLEPFNATFPRPTRSSSIGNGVQFLNRHLSSIMFRNKESLEPLLDFLRTHKHDGHVSLIKLWVLLNEHSTFVVIFMIFWPISLFCWASLHIQI